MAPLWGARHEPGNLRRRRRLAPAPAGARQIATGGPGARPRGRRGPVGSRKRRRDGTHRGVGQDGRPLLGGESGASGRGRGSPRRRSSCPSPGSSASEAQRARIRQHPRRDRGRGGRNRTRRLALRGREGAAGGGIERIPGPGYAGKYQPKDKFRSHEPCSLCVIWRHSGGALCGKESMARRRGFLCDGGPKRQRNAKRALQGLASSPAVPGDRWRRSRRGRGRRSSARGRLAGPASGLARTARHAAVPIIRAMRTGAGSDLGGGLPTQGCSPRPHRLAPRTRESEADDSSPAKP